MQRYHWSNTIGKEIFDADKQSQKTDVHLLS